MDTKHHLLTHAEDLARSRGFDAFSFADLAKGADIRKASVHHHFPTKGDLALAVMDRYADRTLAELAQFNRARAAVRLAAFLDLYRDALEGGRSLCLCVSFAASRASLPDDVKDRVAKFQADITSWLVQAFREAEADGTIAHTADPALEAHHAFALVEGAQLAARAAQSLETYDHATALLRRRLLPEHLT